ncbi:hypothetical protein FRC00_000887, partial [Tulasnella sp. 408]
TIYGHPTLPERCDELAGKAPNVNNTSEPATSSAAPSRTATPATAAFDIAECETPHAPSGRPSARRSRTTRNIDWTPNMVVNTKGELASCT